MYATATMCRVLEVSTSGYYAWCKRPPSARAERDAQLKQRIREIHEQSDGTYGRPRVHAELQEHGEAVSPKWVGRLMREEGLEGVSRRRKVITTLRDAKGRPAPDLVDRRFRGDGAGSALGGRHHVHCDMERDAVPGGGGGRVESAGGGLGHGHASAQ